MKRGLSRTDIHERIRKECQRFLLTERWRDDFKYLYSDKVA